ncbi:hypothetical protein [uncultured Desulfuromusa sp.]|uniref:nSTAND3 domain-containing NTPase n=1 Tax=uncultured Desulfuromusa sp. TaxID=219183 RepID=UPI002AA64CE8|nr:hypothetical protein [uncultured Desulfuromusa sp.]
MSKINQIQQALLELGGGHFQKLADAFLVEKGFGSINAIGSVVASNKERVGTPDSLIATSEGKYIFAEYTTQQSSLLAKLKDDLGKCLDEKKTGIPVSKIDRVIFCFTGKLSAKQESQLAVACQKKGVNLELFGIDALAFDLYSKYPRLALDFLNVQIDTGQIVPPSQFVILYNHGKMATRLDLGFHFRDEELCRLLSGLENEKLVFISGKAGVGKSRLALEVCKKFHEGHPEYEVMCIFGRNRDLWEDLQSRFRKDGKFLLFVDDANRVSRFEYVVELLMYLREDQQIKVVATVRDYALSKVQEAARPLGSVLEVELGPFTDEQIKKLITDEYGITNYHYLERIAEIARGNPRLAVMAAEVAKENHLSSIHDVSSLYDSYFSSIRDDLKGAGGDLMDANLLKVASIVSFFKAVDRLNEEMTISIEKAFGIHPKAFWEAAEKLHELEVLDMYENEVVRVSDQVLGTYLFYLAVFKEKVLDFGVLLSNFFPKLRHRIIDSINPVLNAFESESIVEALCPHIDSAWSKLEKDGDNAGLFELLDVFWFVKRTDTLLWVSERINELDTESIEVSDLKFEKNSKTIDRPSILSILSSFAYAMEEEARIAVELLSRYFKKRPTEAQLIFQILTENYGFNPNSNLRNFEIQRGVIDTLEELAKDGELFISKIYLKVAANFLGTHFDSHRMKGEREVLITRFNLPSTPQIKFLREVIWKRLFLLYEIKELQNEVLDLIGNYCKSSHRLTISDLVKSDYEHLLPFLEIILDKDNYHDCVLFNDYMNLLEQHDLKIPDSLKDQFSSQTFELSKLMLHDWSGMRELDLSFEEFEQFKRDGLRNFTKDFSLEDYGNFFQQCLEIYTASIDGQNNYQVLEAIVNTLLPLADNEPELFTKVINLYLELGDPFELNGYPFVKKLVDHLGPEDTRQFLLRPEYPTKTQWLINVQEVLPSDCITVEWIDRLYELYTVAKLNELPNDFDYLIRYISFDKQVFCKIIKLVISKYSEEDSRFSILPILFNRNKETGKRLLELFSDDFNLLKDAYFFAETTRSNNDYDGFVLNSILDIDQNFIRDYINWKYNKTKDGWVSRHDDHRDYEFIWKRNDYQDVMDRVVDCVYKNDKDTHISSHTYLEVFFQKNHGKGNLNEEVKKKQDTYLLRLINGRNKDSDFMMYLFTLIAELKPERRRQFVECFVKLNKSIYVFKKLPMEPTSWSWEESKVPMLQGRVEFLESLLPVMSTVDLLQHKQRIERRIQHLRAEIEREKKVDFIED